MAKKNRYEDKSDLAKVIEKVEPKTEIIEEPKAEIKAVPKKPAPIFTEGGFAEVQEKPSLERIPTVEKPKIPADRIELYWEERDEIKRLQAMGYVVVEARKTGLLYGKHKVLTLVKGK